MLQISDKWDDINLSMWKSIMKNMRIKAELSPMFNGIASIISTVYNETKYAQPRMPNYN
jgi:hypothetical protein